MLKKFLFGLPFTLAGLVSNAQTILENKLSMLCRQRIWILTVLTIM